MLEEITEIIEEEMEKHEFIHIRLGVQLAGVINSYYCKKLISYLKGENSEGGMYFNELKPLYDEFGYEKVNKALFRLDKEYSKNE